MCIDRNLIAQQVKRLLEQGDCPIFNWEQPTERFTIWKEGVPVLSLRSRGLFSAVRSVFKFLGAHQGLPYPLDNQILKWGFKPTCGDSLNTILAIEPID